LLPRGDKPNPLRDRNAEVNSLLAKLVPKKGKTELVNIDAGFVQSDGTFKFMPLAFHLIALIAGFIRLHFKF